MDINLLKTFSKYQQTVLFEEYELQKITNTMVTDPMQKLVSYYIFEQTMENNHPSQTDILYALRLTHSTLRKILKRLIDVGYIEPVEKQDARFTHYKSTEMVIEGFKIHTARHFKTLIAVAKELGNDKKVLDVIEVSVNKLLGEYKNHTAYGDMNLENLKIILGKLEDKKL